MTAFAESVLEILKNIETDEDFYTHDENFPIRIQDEDGLLFFMRLTAAGLLDNTLEALYNEFCEKADQILNP